MSESIEPAMPPQPEPAPPVPPVPVVKRKPWSASLIWLVPIVAALIGISMVVHNWISQGPSISISFQTAEGLEAGKTQVKYKDVVIGVASAITLSEDRTHVIVQVKLNKDAQSFAAADSRFWVVRPRFGATGISGIGTLLSGAYIGADNGVSKEIQKNFTGLEKPPAVIHGSPGKRFVLHAADIGSLDIGSPVYYRRIQVGRVVSYALNQDGRQMLVDVFVDAPYDKFVNESSRFWNASGVDLNLSAAGLKVNTQSLATVIAGGIGFQTPPGPRDATPVPENTEFKLFDDFQTAMAPPDGEPDYLRMRFDQSLRGLTIDAPVDFHGIVVGKVVSIDLDYDSDKQSFPLIVGAVIYPQRFGRAHDKILQQVKDDNAESRLAHLLKPLVAHGLRAQARTGSLLTGQLYIALDFIPNAKQVAFDDAARPVDLPTAPGSFDKLQEQMIEIVEKIDKIPFESIGKHLDATIADLDGTLKQVNGSVLPQLHTTLVGAQNTLGSAGQAIAEDSPLQQDLARTLAELQRMARSLRTLTDYLGRHPESLIRGKPADPAPAAPVENKEGAAPKGSKP